MEAMLGELQQSQEYYGSFCYCRNDCPQLAVCGTDRLNIGIATSYCAAATPCATLQQEILGKIQMQSNDVILPSVPVNQFLGLVVDIELID